MARLPKHITDQTTVRHLLLALADLHGIRDNVARLIDERATPHRYEFWPLQRILRHRRKELGLTIEQMVQRSGVSKSQLVSHESSQPYLHMKRVAPEVIMKLAKGYDLPIPVVISGAMRTANLVNAPGA